MNQDEAKRFLTTTRPLKNLNTTKKKVSCMKENAEIDQAILDEIGDESSDSECANDDHMPVPSLFLRTRSSFLPRSKSMGHFDTLANDHNCGTDKESYGGSPNGFAAAIERQQPAKSLGRGLRRPASMSQIKIARADYNRAVGEALANSPKKGIINTAEDIAMLEKLLSEL